MSGRHDGLKKSKLHRIVSSPRETVLHTRTHRPLTSRWPKVELRRTVRLAASQHCAWDCSFGDTDWVLCAHCSVASSSGVPRRFLTVHTRSSRRRTTGEGYRGRTACTASVWRECTVVEVVEHTVWELKRGVEKSALRPAQEGDSTFTLPPPLFPRCLTHYIKTSLRLIVA